MKNLLLIAFATLALCLGANVANACPDCEGKAVVKDEKRADKADVKKDADADKAAADTAEAKAKPAAGCESCKGSAKRASCGQVVKADRDATGACSKAAGCGGGCGSGCGGCGTDCGGCDTAKAKEAAKTDKPVKN